MKKKVIAGLLAGALAVSMLGCGSLSLIHIYGEEQRENEGIHLFLPM